MQPLTVSSVAHVNVRTADLQKSIDFYTNILGFTFVSQMDLRPVSPTVSAYVRFQNLVVELACGHEMSQYHTAGIINHFALEVPDAEEALVYFQRHGVPVLQEITNVNDVFLCFFIAGPSGERFEIIQNL